MAEYKVAYLIRSILRGENIRDIRECLAIRHLHREAPEHTHALAGVRGGSDTQVMCVSSRDMLAQERKKQSTDGWRSARTHANCTPDVAEPA